MDTTKQAIPVRTCIGLMDVSAKVDSQEALRGVNGIMRSGELVLALGGKGIDKICIRG